MSNQGYEWSVKQGEIKLQRQDDCIAISFDFQGGERCLLTGQETVELIEMLIETSKQIWEDTSYVKVPYQKQLYTRSDNVFQWKIQEARLEIYPNEIENAIEMKSIGSDTLIIEVNYIIEIVQILEALITE